MAFGFRESTYPSDPSLGSGRNATVEAGDHMTVRRGAARYEISVENPEGVSRGVRYAETHGVVIAERPLRFGIIDDGAIHRIRMTMG